MRSDRLCHAVEHADHHTLLNPGFGRSDGGATHDISYAERRKRDRCELPEFSAWRGMSAQRFTPHTFTKKKPVIACFGSVSASGGYYVSMAVGDKENTIFAEPTCSTGSTGRGRWWSSATAPARSSCRRHSSSRTRSSTLSANRGG